jgi:CRP/FNR family cyclic AMP-dependent transcriptional regulator
MGATDRETATLLRRAAIFAALDDELLRTLASRTRRRQYRRNASVFHEGDPGETLYVIVSGRVNIQTHAAGEQPVHLARRGPGEVFGELALIDGKPRMADAVAIESTDVLVLERSDFLRCVEASPRMALSVLACLADRLRQAAEHLESHQCQDVLGRVSGAILRQMEARAGQDSSGGVRLGARLSQRQLAEEIGTTRESVNRVLRRLKQVGAIRVEGRDLIVLDAGKLRQYSGYLAPGSILQPH